MQMKLENGMPLAVGADLHTTTDRSQSGSQYAGIVSEVVRAIPYRLALRRLLAAMAGFGWRQNRFDESAIRGHVREIRSPSEGAGLRGVSPFLSRTVMGPFRCGYRVRTGW